MWHCLFVHCVTLHPCVLAHFHRRQSMFQASDRHTLRTVRIGLLCCSSPLFSELSNFKQLNSMTVPVKWMLSVRSGTVHGTRMIMQAIQSSTLTTTSLITQPRPLYKRQSTSRLCCSTETFTLMLFSAEVCHRRLKTQFLTELMILRQHHSSLHVRSCDFSNWVTVILKNKTHTTHTHTWISRKTSMWRRRDQAQAPTRLCQIVMYYYRGGRLSSKNNTPAAVS